MTAAPLTAARRGHPTAGSTTRRAGLWQSPTVRRGATDLAAIALLLAAGVQAFGPIFGGAVGYVSAGSGVALGLGLAVVSSWRRWSTLGTLLAGLLLYLGFGGVVALPETTVAGVLPTTETVRRLTLLTWQSWRDLLTVPLPAGDFDGPAVLPFLTGLVCASLAASAALRVRRLGPTIALALGPAAAFLVIGVLWSSRDAPTAALQGALFAVVALGWTSWRAQLGRLDTHVVFLRSAATPRGPRAHQALTASVVLVIAAAVSVGGWLAAPAPDRHVLRDEVEPPLDPQQYASPLTLYRFLEADLDHDVLFTVTGLPAGDRVRLAAMDLYDGNVYNVSDESAEFARVGSSIERSKYSDPDAQPVSLTFRIGRYDGVWLPGGGDLRGVEPSGDLGDIYYNDASGTALVPRGLAAGDEYTVDVALAPAYTAEELAALPHDAQPDFDFPLPDNTATVAAVGAVRPALVGDAATPMDQVRMIREELATKGRFADGDPDPSFPGHSIERITRLLDNEDQDGLMIGDDEQYAVAMALLVRDLGLPARVVMGFYPDPDTVEPGEAVAITGDDAHVWVEVRFDDLGWVPFDPTPPDDQRPQVQQPQPQQREDPQVLPPPDVPEDRDAKAPPPADSNIDKDDPTSDPVWWPIVRLVAIGVGVAGVVIGPFFMIAALKSRRRRRRRTSGPLADRVSGGWSEVIDLATDLGLRVPPPATRFEAAMLLEGRMRPESTVPVAQRVDAHVFGQGEPTEVEVEAVWAAVDRLRSEFRESATFRDRFRQRFSLRSLVRRPEWLARAELRASGGSR